MSFIADSPVSPTFCDEQAFRVELDVLQDKRDIFLKREVLRWLTFAIRPLAMSELRAILQFIIKTEGLRFVCPEDMAIYLRETFPLTVELREIPAATAYANFDGEYAWKTQLKLHASIRTKAIQRTILTFPRSHHFAFDSKNGHIKLAEICLKYLSMVSDIGEMTEAQKIENCAEYFLLKYALDSFAEHAASAPRACLRIFLETPIFRATCVESIAHTLLPWAAKHSDLEMFEIVLASIPPNAREGGRQSHTALSHASIRGNTAMVDLLISHPSIEVDILTFCDMTPLHLAIQNENFEIARLLMSRGLADPSLREFHGWNALRLLFRTTGSKSVALHHSELIWTLDQIVCSSHPTDRFEIHHKDIDSAAQSGNLEALKYLIQKYKPFVIPSSPLDEAQEYSALEKGKAPVSDYDETSHQESSIRCRESNVGCATACLVM